MFVIRVLFLSLFLMSIGFQAFAGGPLAVKDGIPVTYKDKPFVYRYDLGNLGKLTNLEIVAIIEDLFSTWEDVKTAKIKFEQDTPGFLDFDVNETSFSSILEPEGPLGFSPIVFDEDGNLLQTLLGKGAENGILGITGTSTIDSGPMKYEIIESHIILNGKFVNGVKTQLDYEVSVESLKGAILHEVGHAIGLDHSQINSGAAAGAIINIVSKEIIDSVPLMFPFPANDLFKIKRDDISSVSLLYPNEEELVNFGQISGKVFKKDGITPHLGANVIARNVDNSLNEAISCVSGYLLDGTGSFKLFALPPGRYRIEIEPINPYFTGGSHVGPYSFFQGDLSFIDPPPSGFYTGPNQPITTDINQALIVEVKANEVLKDINIIAGTISESDPNSTDDLITTSEDKFVTLPQQAVISFIGVPEGAESLSIPVTIDENFSKLTAAMISIFGTIGSINDTGVDVQALQGVLPELFTVNVALKGVMAGSTMLSIGTVMTSVDEENISRASASINSKTVRVFPRDEIKQISEAEPNDSIDQAQIIDGLTTVSGFVSSNDDSGKLGVFFGTTRNEIIINDLYKIEIKEPTILSTSLLSKSFLITDDLDLFLFDKTGDVVLARSVEPRDSGESISTFLKKGTYLLGVGAISGEAPYELTIATSPLGKEPFLELPPKEGLLLQATEQSVTNLIARGINFKSSSTCTVSENFTGLLKITPRHFVLGKRKKTRKIKVSIPQETALTINNPRAITLNIECRNGASNQTDIILVPIFIQDVFDLVN